MRPTFSLINLTNLRNNFISIRKKVGNAKVMAVIKADAYGHGAIECARALNMLGKNRPEYFGVALLEEAVELRKNDVKEPILVFGTPNEIGAELYSKYNISATVYRLEHLHILRSANPGKRVKFHIKVNTGMNRIGVNFEEALEFIEFVSAYRSAQIEGVYTHFAASDEKNKNFANIQLNRFKKIIQSLKNKSIKFGLAHAANSGAILDMPNSYFDMVRPGISLYGYYPSTKTSESIKLSPVMQLLSRVEELKELTKGESISYGRLYYAKKNIDIAAVPLGYADGYPRGLTNKAKAIINGKEFKQVGRVCMDRIMFEVDAKHVKIGDRVILLGEDGKLRFDAANWSRILNTIPYEITCGISKRVPRIYCD